MKHLIIFILLLSTTCFAQSNVVPDQDEFNALKALWESTSGMTWVNRSGWPSKNNWPSTATASEMDAWYGIVVTNGDVTELRLMGNKLTGQLPSLLGKLSKLRYVDLHGNNLSGTVPPIFSPMADLVLLDLAFNRFEGLLPVLRGVTININNNQFNGTLTSPAGGSRVSVIHAENNNFNAIASSISSLTSLQVLMMANNELTTLPVSLLSLPAKAICQLYMNDNRLDFSQLAPMMNAGFNPGSVWGGQKKINNIRSKSIIPGNSFTLTASPPGGTGINTIKWEKQDPRGSWVAIDGSDQDAALQTYTRTSATDADQGNYRWTATNSKFSFPLQSDLIVVKSATGFVLDNWCFQYKYDGRRRVTHKKVPGADWIYMVYDDRDRLVMTQDGNQRTLKQWSFTRYDALNRPIITGLYTHTNMVDQETMSSLVSRTNFYETFNGTHTFFGYTNTVMPSTQFGGTIEPLTVTYYDNYDHLGSDQYFQYKPHRLNGQASTAFGRVKGQVTGTWTRILGEDRQWIRTVNYYDDRQRLIQVISDNHKRHQIIRTNVYDFMGRITASKTESIDHRVNWDNGYVLAVSNDRLKYTINGGISRAFSRQQIPADTDGWVEFTCSGFNGAASARGFGLSNGTPDQISYSIQQTRTATSATSLIQVQENGVSTSNSINVDGGDVMRIERKGMTMYYSKNGVVFWTTKLSTRPALNAHAVLNLVNSELFNPRISLDGSTRNVERHFDYDHAGRLLRTWHSVDDEKPVLLVNNVYNELGQLTDKSLHGKGGQSFHQSINYGYNIRGWLTSMTADLFGMELLYTKADQGIGNKAMFNGNISAITWANNFGAGEASAYRFDYDAMNRLNNAIHKNYNGKWTTSKAFDESGISYDLNGNIKSLTRTDSSGATMDNLVYNYGDGTANQGNRLLWVKDNGSAGGFIDGANIDDDYSYDNNGNMIVDKNKSIQSISYNHLNLPVRVTKISGDYVQYTYDAKGSKLIQDVYGVTGALKKRSDYVDDWFYEDDTLKFVDHEEGRVVLTDGQHEYQYHLKDHLGNVRMSFTTKDDRQSATATLETDHKGEDRGNFLNYDKARLIKSSLFDRTNGMSAGYAQRLSGSEGERIGLARSFSVMPGDTIRAEVYAKYVDPDSENLAEGLELLLGYVMYPALGPAGTVIDGPGYSTPETTIPGLIPIDHPEDSDHSLPKAYLNYIFINRNFDLGSIRPIAVRINGGSEEGSDGPHAHLKLEDVITEPGYVYVYLSNDGDEPREVYFDDFTVKHVKSPVVQMDDYYPFGMRFNSYVRENSLVNRSKLFQGQEQTDDLELKWIAFKWRNHQPEIGRFFNVDPLADKYVYNSPYAFSENKVVSHVELEGLEAATPEQLVQAIAPEKKVEAEYRKQDDKIIISPVEDPVINSEFGPREKPVPGASDPHPAVDIVRTDPTQTEGTLVVAPVNGKITAINDQSDGNGAGNRIHMTANVDGKRHSFFHMREGFASNLSVGQDIKRGTALGQVGATGNVSGPHLHYEVRQNGIALNPRIENPGLANAPSEIQARSQQFAPTNPQISGVPDSSRKGPPMYVPSVYHSLQE